MNGAHSADGHEDVEDTMSNGETPASSDTMGNGEVQGSSDTMSDGTAHAAGDTMSNDEDESLLDS